MGNKFTIKTWELSNDFGEDGEYHYEIYWMGESLLKAILYMIEAKNKGIKCIKLEWRP